MDAFDCALLAFDFSQLGNLILTMVIVATDLLAMSVIHHFTFFDLPVEIVNLTMRHPRHWIVGAEFRNGCRHLANESV